MKRRTYIGGTVSLISVGLAGCVGDSLDIDLADNSSADNSSAANSSSDSSPDEERSSADDADETRSYREAEMVAEEYILAFAEQHTERQEKLRHEELRVAVSPIGGTPNETVTIRITNSESRTVDEIAEEHTQHVSDREIDATKQSIQEEIADIGAVDYTYVHVRFEVDDRDHEESDILLVDDGEDWLVYGIGVDFESLEPTDTESSQDATNRLQVLSAVGFVSDHETVDEISLTVTKSPDSDDIALEQVAYSVITDSGSVSDRIAADQISVITAETDDNLITDRTDRYQLSFEATTHFDTALESSDNATIRLTTESGSFSSTGLRVPDSLVDRDAVVL